MKRAFKPVKPPKDIRAFWVADHCGPGTRDPEAMCGFCGEPGAECAKAMSDIVKDHPDWLHDGSILGDGNDDPESVMGCGGCGFWCSECGRFWAQNACGEAFPGEMYAADGVEQVVKDEKVYCVCGKQLARLRPDSE